MRKLGSRRKRKFKGTIRKGQNETVAKLGCVCGFRCELSFPKSFSILAEAFLPWLQYRKTYCSNFLKSCGLSRRSSHFWRLFRSQGTNFFARSQSLGCSQGRLCDIISRPLAASVDALICVFASTWTLLWFRHGCFGLRICYNMDVNSYMLGMDALVCVFARTWLDVVVWAWMLWAARLRSSQRRAPDGSEAGRNPLRTGSRVAAQDPCTTRLPKF